MASPLAQDSLSQSFCGTKMETKFCKGLVHLSSCRSTLELLEASQTPEVGILLNDLTWLANSKNAPKKQKFNSDVGLELLLENRWSTLEIFNPFIFMNSYVFFFPCHAVVGFRFTDKLFSPRQFKGFDQMAGYLTSCQELRKAQAETWTWHSWWTSRDICSHWGWRVYWYPVYPQSRGSNLANMCQFQSNSIHFWLSHVGIFLAYSNRFEAVKALADQPF